MIALTDSQQRIAAAPFDTTIFLHGPAGSGKTTAAVARLLHLLAAGISAGEILVLVPQRVLALPYLRALRFEHSQPGGQVSALTLGGLSRSMVELFWPLIADRAGFGMPKRPPTFLSLETAQYVMARVVEPLIERAGYFEAVTVERNRIYSQILDNLNKAALVGFPFTSIGERLKSSWLGDAGAAHTFDQAQDCANRFRAYCLEHNLLDFSLQMEVFARHVWRLPACHTYLVKRYRHLIVDNVEEDAPVVHDLLAEWLAACASALVVYDEDAGFRRFLGADPDHAEATLRPACAATVAFSGSHVMSADVEALGAELARTLGEHAPAVHGDARAALSYDDHRFFPQMLNALADQIAHLVHEEGTPPGQIVVLAPFLSDSLRFSLMNQLRDLGVPARSHRPSRALRDEPAARSLLTLAMLAHPEWELAPPPLDITHALMGAIGGLAPGETIDLVRAELLASAVYPAAESRCRLASFSALDPAVQQRVGFIFGERYEALRGWLEDYIALREQPPPPAKRRRKKDRDDEPKPSPALAPVELDHFLSRLFGEVLSRRGFGFFGNFEAADVAANLIDSARGFRQTLAGKAVAGSEANDALLGREYVEIVLKGVIANQYIRSWQNANALLEGAAETDAVLLAPAYTFLMINQPVHYQFWLDIGSRGWFERLYQPLTHPYVLSRQWRPGDQWNDQHEQAIRTETLYRLTQGLIRRCRRGIVLGLSELGESGYESRGELLLAIQRLLRRLAAAGKALASD